MAQNIGCVLAERTQFFLMISSGALELPLRGYVVEVAELIFSRRAISRRVLENASP
jgi:hypothetical protein